MAPQTRTTDHGLAADAREFRQALSELMRVYGFRDRDRICCYDVSVRQSHALDVLAVRGALALNDLAAALYLDKSTASRIVDALERKGYAARGEHPESRRSILVSPTHAGLRLQAAIERDLLAEEERLLEEFEQQVGQAAALLVSRMAAAAATRVEAAHGTCCSVP
jgi:MarR family transcriptional regulator, 2-MHQ and catechol-resistance regulon repressor